MKTYHQQTVVIQSGGLISLSDPELPAGMDAKVTIEVVPGRKELPSLESYRGKGTGLFRSADDIDAYIREMRDE